MTVRCHNPFREQRDPSWQVVRLQIWVKVWSFPIALTIRHCKKGNSSVLNVTTGKLRHCTLQQMIMTHTPTPGPKDCSWLLGILQSQIYYYSVFSNPIFVLTDLNSITNIHYQQYLQSTRGQNGIIWHCCCSSVQSVVQQWQCSIKPAL